MKTINIKQIDAFTTTPFFGNPAGVVTDATSITDDEKQKIAREMNLSETAFVLPSEVADFKVQFFTPKFEVDLCGHATIATFFALYEEKKLDLSKNIFFQETKAGVLSVELADINGEKVFMMTQPSPKFEQIDIDKNSIAKLIGLSENDLIDISAKKVNTGLWWLVFGVKSLDKLMNAKLDLRAIEEISEKYNVIGITPFCLETLNEEYSYHMRASAPIAGAVEDPVCGTGNGCVSSYIVHNKLIECNENISLIGEEGIEVNRPGCAYVSISKLHDEISEIKIGGTGVTALNGELAF